MGIITAQDNGESQTKFLQSTSVFLQGKGKKKGVPLKAIHLSALCSLALTLLSLSLSLSSSYLIFLYICNPQIPTQNPTNFKIQGLSKHYSKSDSLLLLQGQFINDQHYHHPEACEMCHLRSYPRCMETDLHFNRIPS